MNEEKIIIACGIVVFLAIMWVYLQILKIKQSVEENTTHRIKRDHERAYEHYSNLCFRNNVIPKPKGCVSINQMSTEAEMILKIKKK